MKSKQPEPEDPGQYWLFRRSRVRNSTVPPISRSLRELVDAGRLSIGTVEDKAKHLQWLISKYEARVKENKSGYRDDGAQQGTRPAEPPEPVKVITRRDTSVGAYGGVTIFK